MFDSQPGQFIRRMTREIVSNGLTGQSLIVSHGWYMQ